jgi:dsDNA-binding SOS-regulon protein
MAVITKFVVVRDGVELEQVFLDKKEAEAYDKLLDAAQSLAELIKQGDLQIDIDPRTIDEIAICLAKNAPAVTKILKSVKPLNPEPEEPHMKPSQAELSVNKEKTQESRSRSKTKAA